MQTLYFSTRFKKRYRLLPKGLRSKVDERLMLFQLDPWNPVLDNHSLGGEYMSFRSIDITGDWRALYEPIAESAAHFVRIGTHAELYS